MSKLLAPEALNIVHRARCTLGTLSCGSTGARRLPSLLLGLFRQLHALTPRSPAHSSHCLGVSSGDFFIDAGLFTLVRIDERSNSVPVDGVCLLELVTRLQREHRLLVARLQF